MEIRLASDLQQDSIVDGEGIRTVIWTQGCSHNCKGCHNPSTHDFKGGFAVDTSEINDEISRLEGQEGITFTGGDPMFQAEACTEIAKFARKQGLDIWCYTGFKFEDLIKIPKFKRFLDCIDVLVDGKFIEEEKSLNLDFRGSRNQRIIDVKASLEKGKVVTIPKYEEERIVDVSVVHPAHVYV